MFIRLTTGCRVTYEVANEMQNADVGDRIFVKVTLPHRVPFRPGLAQRHGYILILTLEIASELLIGDVYFAA